VGSVGTILVTGGAGFIGSNAAARFLAKGARVRIFDNFSRPGAVLNEAWLRSLGGSLEVLRADVRDAGDLLAATRGADVVLHLAAQTAVTTSVQEPRPDFEVNALGSFNVLEAARAQERKPFVLYASTNKVYGGMEDVAVADRGHRYEYRDLPTGTPEARPLDFHSPYGCSKGAADQYTRDYARIYGVPTVVFRQSCIYGRRQFGSEDQGWVAHFVLTAMAGKPLTIFGNGKQVRDVLDVADLLDAFEAAIERRDRIVGRIYNIGGGPSNTLSLLELVERIEQRLRHKIAVSFTDWRPGDQRVYVSDVSLAARELGWKPRTNVERGLEGLFTWAQEALAVKAGA
jgi:CDP-paratose 2-epimerase